MATEINLTENEIAILKGARDNEYQDGTEECTSTWVFAVVDESGLDPKTARGVISSLVKKGLAIVDDYEGKGRSDDMTFELTPEGIQIANKVLNASSEDK